MVPVRKPGRPLSACPHPRDKQCGCGSVTAAIPRKQTCHCGTSTPPTSSGQATSQHSHEGSTDAPSPNKPTFKVQKATSRPASSKKQSFDPVNFERMDMNSINIVPFEQRSHGGPIPFANGYALPGAQQPYGYGLQYANIQPPFSHIPIQAPHMPPAIPAILDRFNREDDNGLEHVIESHLATPTELTKSGSNGTTKASSCCTPSAVTNGINGKTNGTTNSGSCCASKQPSHSHSSSTASSISEPQEIKAGGCCSSEAAPHMMKKEPPSYHGTPIMTPQIGLPFNPALYPHYLPQTTVFTYPSTYGSFQNPLQPEAWRQSVRTNNYTPPQMEAPLPPASLPFNTPVVPESLDTVHTCSCGDGCQCIGCAAHPYNDATQDYVRSAWSSMNLEQTPGEMYANGQSNGNGQPVSVGEEAISSPTAHTPSSATSGNGEEQSLSASDFFFVNYPFDGCGGETQSCPCGDDCQCLGCTIHRQPPIPCEGERDACPCGDDCECIGCEIHNGTVKV
jgi:hypothetical protein